MSLLQACGVTKVYGGLQALTDVDLTVMPGESVAVIGPNGAGKSTFLNVLTGLTPPTTGRVLLDGADVTKLATHKRVRLGIGRTFQHGRLFSRMSVLENVMTAAEACRRDGDDAPRETAMRVLERMGLAAQASDAVGSLSYGQRRMVEMCRVLAGRPRVLLLDEPAAGLNSGEVEQLVERLTALREEHSVAVVLIEHNMGMVMRFAERILVLNFGSPIAEGTPEEIQSDPAVLTAYLGEGYSHADL